MEQKIQFYLNGKLRVVANEMAHLMLADYLRRHECLTGTKVVCAEGDCGACSVLKYHPLHEGEDSDFFRAINSCIAPVATLHGSHIITVEALKHEDKLHEAQRAMVENHGSQCGFCTPGFVMALAGLCEEKIACKSTSIEANEAKNCMTGNLCRCTGYEGIINAALDMKLDQEKSLKDRYHTHDIESHLKEICDKDLLLDGKEISLFLPTTYDKALKHLKDFPETKIIASGTDLGVVHNKRKIKLQKLMGLHLIKEAYQINVNNDVVEVGAKCTLSQFRHFLKNHLPEYAQYLDIFASPQIKNSATLIGNIANASPIGDNAPALLALDAEVVLKSTNGERKVLLSEFFLDYRKTDRKKDELITKICFKFPTQRSFRIYKSSIRKDLDISIVNLAINTDYKNDKIQNVLIAAGGVAAIPLRLKKTEDYLNGKNLSPKTIEEACRIAQGEFNPLSDVRGTSSYRRILISNYLKRYFSQLKEGSL